MQLCNKLKDNGEKLMRKPERSVRGTINAPIAAVVILATIALGGCVRANARPLIDRAFALIYPELSARILGEFGDARLGKGQSPEDVYLPLPFVSSSANISSKEIYIASPAIAAALVGQVEQTGASVIGLLSNGGAFPSVNWHSAWAYRQMGLIAGYRTAALRVSTHADSRASILFSRGIGRSDAELKAFECGFAEGARAAGFQDLETCNDGPGGVADSNAPQSLLLTVFDVDSMELHGDRLEQTLAACEQMLQGSPSVVVVAAGSLGALQKALDMPGDVIADLRGLGQQISKKKLFAATEENIDGLVHATERVVRAMREKKPIPDITLVPPSLYLSEEARRSEQGLLNLRNIKGDHAHGISSATMKSKRVAQIVISVPVHA